MKAEAILSINRDWKEDPFAETDGPKLVKGTFHMEYKGEMEGTAELGELKLYHSDNKAEMFGFQRFTGSVHGKKGSFVFKYEGKFENGVVDSVWNVVENSGTDELKNIKGKIHFNSEGKKEFSIVFDYTL